jgi:hypothetical protein
MPSSLRHSVLQNLVLFCVGVLRFSICGRFRANWLLSCDISNIAIVNIFYRIQEKIINKIYFFKVRKINKIYRIFIYLFISDIFFTSPDMYYIAGLGKNIFLGILSPEEIINKIYFPEKTIINIFYRKWMKTAR